MVPTPSAGPPLRPGSGGYGRRLAGASTVRVGAASTSERVHVGQRHAPAARRYFAATLRYRATASGAKTEISTATQMNATQRSVCAGVPSQ
jgi:hypothetical protein